MRFGLISLVLSFELFVLVSSTLTEFSVDSKIYISQKLKENFLNSNLNQKSKAEFHKSLEIFQKNLLKLRNSECNIENKNSFEIELKDYSKLNDSIWIETIQLWSNLDKLIEKNQINKINNNVNLIVNNLNKMCIDTKSLINLFGFYENSSKYQNLSTNENLFNLVLTQLTNTGCSLCSNSSIKNDSITKLETWGYGILFVTIISASSLCGAFVIPLSNKKIYKKILMLLIGVAVGSLAGSGFLHLIPQAFGITEDANYTLNHNYVWKGLVMMVGVYLFYLVEKIMKIMIYRKKLLKKSNSNMKNSTNEKPRILESIGYIKTHEQNVEPSVEMRVHINEETMAQKKSQNHHGHSHDLENLQSVAPVAWMIIFGDGLHNFIDGLSIGAAFTESILKGISICLAVICEEFPHELGDFAILLNAGMSYPVALLFNFLSACCCYIGLAVGITIGENFSANEWIYAIAGGMFLYISLCDMIPELNEMGDEIERDYLEEKFKLIHEVDLPEEEKKLDNSNKTKFSNDSFDLGIKLKVLAIQNIGIVSGFSFMLIMAIYSENIQF